MYAQSDLKIGDVDDNGDLIVAGDDKENCIVKTPRGAYYFCNPGTPGEYLRGKRRQALEVAACFSMVLGEELENVI